MQRADVLLVVDAGIGTGTGDSYYIPDVVVLLAAAVVKAGQKYRATHPFPVEIDPADLF